MESDRGAGAWQCHMCIFSIEKMCGEVSSFHKQQGWLLLLYDIVWHPLQNVVWQCHLTDHDQVHCLGVAEL